MASLTRTSLITFGLLVVAAASAPAQTQQDVDVCKAEALAKSSTAAISASPDTSTTPDRDASETRGTATSAPQGARPEAADAAQDDREFQLALRDCLKARGY